MTPRYMTEGELLDLYGRIRSELETAVHSDPLLIEMLRLQLKLVEVRLSILRNVCRN